MRKVKRHDQAGITLIELVVAIAIVALVATFASQGATRAIYASRTAAGLASLIASLTRARSVAASTEIDVVLCPSVDGKTCSAGFHWEGGWIAFQATRPGSNHVADEADRRARTGARFQSALDNQRGPHAHPLSGERRAMRAATPPSRSATGAVRDQPARMRWRTTATLHATTPDSANVSQACAGL